MNKGEAKSLPPNMARNRLHRFLVGGAAILFWTVLAGQTIRVVVTVAFSRSGIVNERLALRTEVDILLPIVLVFAFIEEAFLMIRTTIPHHRINVSLFQSMTNRRGKITSIVDIPRRDMNIGDDVATCIDSSVI